MWDSRSSFWRTRGKQGKFPFMAGKRDCGCLPLTIVFWKLFWKVSGTCLFGLLQLGTTGQLIPGFRIWIRDSWAVSGFRIPAFPYASFSWCSSSVLWPNISSTRKRVLFANKNSDFRLLICLWLTLRSWTLEFSLVLLTRLVSSTGYHHRSKWFRFLKFVFSLARLSLPGL